MSDFKPAIPNLLTLSRILAIPFLIFGILALSSQSLGAVGNAAWVISLYLYAAISDYLDGYLARKWNVSTDFGRMIDPIADKLFVAGCLFALALASHGAPEILIPALIIIGRDILVSGAREHAALQSRAMPPTNLAKWKTACEMLAILLLIFWLAFTSTDINTALIARKAGTVFLWLAAALSAYTGSLYLRAALHAK